MNTDHLLTYTEAAQILRLSPATLRKKVMERSVPFIKLFGRKGRVLFERAALERFIESKKVAVEE